MKSSLLALPLSLLLLLSVTGRSTCHRPDGNGARDAALPAVSQDTLNRRQLQRAAYRTAETWRFVYCPLREESEDEYRKLLREIAATKPFGKMVIIENCRELEGLSANYPVFWFGGKLPDLLTTAPPAGYPLRPTAAGFSLSDQTYNRPGDGLSLYYYAHPSGEPQVISYFLYNTDELLPANLRRRFGSDYSSMFWASWAYETFRNGGAYRLGAYLNRESFAFDPANEIEFTTTAEPLSQRPHLRAYGWDGAAPPALDSILDAAEERVSELAAELGIVATESRIDLYFYPSIERIGLRRQRMDAAQPDLENRELHLVENNYFRGAATGRELELLLHAAGAGSTALCRGLAARLGPDSTRLLAYAARLAASDNLPPLEEILLEKNWSGPESELVWTVAATGYADFLLARDGRVNVLRELANYGTKTTAAEATAYRNHLKKIELKRPAFPAAPATGFLRGFTFAHEGYRGYNGYGGRSVRPALDALAELDVNALAVVPYSFLPAARAPGDIPVPTHMGSENDFAVTYSLREARRRGWFALLKPQIWVSGAWPGDVDYDDAADWDKFFDRYYRWLRHYALLADMEGADGLAVGTELVQATLKYPARWQAMITKIRGIYRGKLTYAANWGEEFENVTFLKEFDAIGLNAYYPLSDNPAATDEELLAGARTWLDRAAQRAADLNKPLWLTEVGFRSVTAPWVNPHAEAGDRAADAAAQARAYRALARAATETSRLEGVFIWKWPSYLTYTGADDTGFAPVDKPAAGVIRDWFREMEKRK